MRLALAVAFSGAIGSCARRWLGGWVQRRVSAAGGATAVFPAGTLAVNLLGCLAIGFLAAACGGEARRGDDLDTVDVTAKPDADASLADEATARPIGAPAVGISGALPADFPRQVPLPSPSSLVDFASRGGDSSVTLVVDQPSEVVREMYLRQLAAAGFQEQADESFTGHGLTVRFRVVAFDEASRLTVRVARG